MKKNTAFCLLALAAAPAVQAEDSMRPGLWEMHILSTVFDEGKKSPFADMMTAQMEQTKKMMASVADKDPRVSKDGNPLECITPEMAREFLNPKADDPGCQIATLEKDSSHMRFRATCNTEGTKAISEVLVEVPSKELIKMQTSTTITLPGGDTHVVKNEMENRFVKADCGAVKPEPKAAAGAK